MVVVVYLLSCVQLSVTPTDCNPPGFSVHGILQARILEWVAISFPRGSSWPRDQTRVSCTAGRFLTHWITLTFCIMFHFFLGHRVICRMSTDPHRHSDGVGWAAPWWLQFWDSASSNQTDMPCCRQNPGWMGEPQRIESLCQDMLGTWIRGEWEAHLCCYLSNAPWHHQPRAGTAAGHMLNHNSPWVCTQVEAAVLAERGKPGRAQGARGQGTDGQGPITGRQGGIEKQTVHRWGSKPECVLHYPVRLHLWDINPKITSLRMVKEKQKRMVKVFLKLSSWIILKVTKGKTVKIVALTLSVGPFWAWSPSECVWP